MCAARNEDVARGDILAGAAHVGARPHRLVEGHGVAALRRELHGHDGVDAGGHRGAGHDLCRVAGADRLREPQTGRYIDGDAEVTPSRLELRAAHGEAVHGRVVEAGHALRRDDLGSRRAAKSFKQGHRLGRHRADRAEHGVNGFIDADHGVLPRWSLICLRILVNFAAPTPDSLRRESERGDVT